MGRQSGKTVKHAGGNKRPAGPVGVQKKKQQANGKTSNIHKNEKQDKGNKNKPALSAGQKKQKEAQRAQAAKALVNNSGLGLSSLSSLLDNTAAELADRSIKVKKVKKAEHQRLGAAAPGTQDMQAEVQPLASPSALTATARTSAKSPAANDLLASLGSWGL